MAWYNPSTWKPVDNIQNKLGATFGSVKVSPSTTGKSITNLGSSKAYRSSEPVTVTNRIASLAPYDGGYYDPQAAVYGGGGGPSPQEVALSNLRGDATSRIQSILSAYDALFGGVDATVRDKTDQLNQGYDSQTQSLNKAYEATQGQTGSAYAARGLGQSSFLGDAMGQNTDVYNQNNQALINDRNNPLADLGRYAATTKAQFGAGKDSYNQILGQLGNYGEADLQSLIPSLQQAYGNIQGQAAGLGSNSDFIKGLNNITPVQNRGVDQLGSRLQALVQSGTPRFAKNALANGLIKQTGLTDPTQQSYWQNYYNQLIGG